MEKVRWERKLVKKKWAEVRSKYERGRIQEKREITTKINKQDLRV